MRHSQGSLYHVYHVSVMAAIMKGSVEKEDKSVFVKNGFCAQRVSSTY